MNPIRKLIAWLYPGTTKITYYRFPVFRPGEGGGEYVEVGAMSYVEARKAVMAQVDTGRFLVGPGVEVTAEGKTLH